MEIEIQKVGTKEQDDYLRELSSQGKEIWTNKNCLEKVLKTVFEDYVVQRDLAVKIGMENYIPIKKECLKCNIFPKHITEVCPTFQVFNPNNKEIKFVFQFLKPKSFTSPEQCAKDLHLTCILSSCGWKVIEIPYYIQLNYENLLALSKEKFKNFSGNNFPNGFVHPDLLTFGHFCERGLRRSKEFLDVLPVSTILDIYETLFYQSKRKHIPFEFLNPMKEIEILDKKDVNFPFNITKELNIDIKYFIEKAKSLKVPEDKYFAILNIIYNFEKKFFNNGENLVFINNSLIMVNGDVPLLRKYLEHIAFYEILNSHH